MAESWTDSNRAITPNSRGSRSGAAVVETAAPGRARRQGRFEALELPDGWTVADLVGARLIVPHRGWCHDDAELVLAVLSAWPGYAATFTWTSLGADLDGQEEAARVRLEEETAPGGLASHQVNSHGLRDMRSGGTAEGGQSSAGTPRSLAGAASCPSLVVLAAAELVPGETEETA